MNGETVQMIMTLVGGLALFIFGMNFMSDGLQKAAGDKMRSILALLTKNPVLGVVAGALVTAVLQSSSATTVMVIGFVSAGLMKLPQAISIILGANIGTTITAQLIAFNIGDYAWAFVAVGFILYFFMKKKEFISYIGQTTFGFGVLFVGINIMGDTMEPLASSQVFVDLMMQVQDIPVLGVLLGTCMTVIVQSSSATIAVFQNLASTAGPDGITSIIGLQGALPILFGDNIGTTITAVLASIGASVTAKRTAAAHVIFNLTGTLLFVWFIPYYAKFIQYISPQGAEVDVISRQIANAHLGFNLFNTIWFIPLIGVLVKVVTKIIPGKELDKLPADPVYLDYNVLEQPFAAIHLATKELVRLGRMSFDMIVSAQKAFIGNDSDAVKKVMETEDTVDELQGKILNYLSAMVSREKTTEEQGAEISGLMHVAADIEHVGDHCKNIAEFADAKIKNSYEFSEEAYSEIYSCFDLAKKMAEDSISSLENDDLERAKGVRIMETEMDTREKELRAHHMERLTQKKCSPEFTVIYTDVIHDIEKIGDYCNNIADAVIENHKVE
ncbi:Na/Pi cotransporter family protein [Mogibacterium sp. NSJ-24]|uniref:Na/Pi cotransporter family protein n=1 Tax=Lentihominibacter hominis TaxID=2763645 RepID=A0A926EAG7_9FIRM|nr:Na/Pi cotransporter family protein [Lentihominibacter hominis]MBC8568704.1 Na/Pi cotransporter family protein [Lentihominibacter hominis]